MRLYEIVQKVDDLLTPDTHLLYNYILKTSDNNGTFLRTSCIIRPTSISDEEVGEVEFIIAAFQDSFKETDICIDYNRELGHIPKMKLQIYFNSNLRSKEKAIETNKLLGYPFYYVIDL